jgi:hypothetical protein
MEEETIKGDTVVMGTITIEAIVDEAFEEKAMEEEVVDEDDEDAVKVVEAIEEEVEVVVVMSTSLQIHRFPLRAEKSATMEHLFSLQISTKARQTITKSRTDFMALLIVNHSHKTYGGRC